VRLAAAAGVAMRAAVRRTPLVLDGPAASVAALVAYEAAPRAVRWWCAADLGDDPVHELALTRLGQKPVLGLGTSLGDGLGALLAVPVLQAAVRLAGEAT
jgi:nicotinate-nucleotide--dimethylbenzimidazole phosphoribosyltransferase